MSLTPEQNAAWCRKCIDIIKGDETVSEPKGRVFYGMDRLEIETTEGGVFITQQGPEGGNDTIFIPYHFIKTFTKELLDEAGLA